MLWFAVQNPAPLALTWSLSTMLLPALAGAVAAVPLGVAAYKALTGEKTYRPKLRALDGGRPELTLKPA